MGNVKVIYFSSHFILVFAKHDLDHLLTSLLTIEDLVLLQKLSIGDVILCELLL